MSRIWPFRDFVESGALLAAGSDWPVVPLPNPWFGLGPLPASRVHQHVVRTCSTPRLSHCRRSPLPTKWGGTARAQSACS